MAQTSYGECEWIPIRSSDRCPICGSKKGRCSMYVKKDTGSIVLYRCKYKESSRLSDGWYLHLASELNGTSSSESNATYIKLEDYKQKTITDSDLILWDKVYKKFREVFTRLNGSALYKEHLENLLNRGYSELEINNMGYFSIPRSNKINYENYTCKMSTAVIKELQKTFKMEDLLKVPGFSKGSYKGTDFVTFWNTMKNKETNQYEDIDGYFIPYHNPNGLLDGMQFRLTKAICDDDGKEMRYLWYSSKNVTCGSPIDYYVPMQIDIDDVILVTEGAIKAKLAASKLKIRSLGEAGVGNYRNLVKNLQTIEKIENKKYKILLALDMDKYSNSDVIRAEIRTVTLLKSLGYSVTILEWNDVDGKGIDDKLLKSGTKGLRYLGV